MPFHLDFETRSAVDLKKYGAARYASDPSTRILMVSISYNGEGPYLVIGRGFSLGNLDDSDPRGLELLIRLSVSNEEIYAHNVGFEIMIAEYRMQADLGTAPPARRRWRCTAAMARRAGLPYSLDAVSTLLKLPQQKDASGKALIQLFCVPNLLGEFNEPQDHPEEFEKFGLYCLQDNRAERDLHARLKPFEVARKEKGSG